MKRIISLLLALSMIFVLCACGSAKDERIVSRLERRLEQRNWISCMEQIITLDEDGLEYETVKAAFEEMLPQIQNLVLESTNKDTIITYMEYAEKISESFYASAIQLFPCESIEENWRSCLDVVVLFDDEGLKSEFAKTAFEAMLPEVQKQVFKSECVDDIIDYIDYAEKISAGYYASVMQLFPYDGFVDAIKSVGEKAITDVGKGGYYDGENDTSEDYWYSPLFKTISKRGEIGTYHHIKEEIHYGDFELFYRSKYWFDTNANDPNNDSYGCLYYKGRNTDSSYKDAKAFINYVKKDNADTYALVGNKKTVSLLSKKTVLIGIKGGFIHVLNGNGYVLQYT